jgi:hypothetical protein
MDYSMFTNLRLPDTVPLRLRTWRGRWTRGITPPDQRAYGAGPGEIRRFARTLRLGEDVSDDLSCVAAAVQNQYRRKRSAEFASTELPIAT